MLCRRAVHRGVCNDPLKVAEVVATLLGVGDEVGF